MTCGLPTFATCHGGPAEIIEHGISGFHIDPYHTERVTVSLVNFFERTQGDRSYWNQISERALARIYGKYEVCFNVVKQICVHILTNI